MEVYVAQFRLPYLVVVTRAKHESDQSVLNCGFCERKLHQLKKYISRLMAPAPAAGLAPRTPAATAYPAASRTTGGSTQRQSRATSRLPRISANAGGAASFITK